MAAGERVRGLFELTRAGNAVAAGGLTFVGAVVAVDVTAPGQHGAVTAAVAATVLATAAGNAVNDYFDRDVDAVNDPDRPIPRGAVTPRGALGFSGLLFAGATVAALTLPAPALAIAVVNLLALLAYTELFKGRPGAGNALVAYLGGSTFLFGGAAVAGTDPDALAATGALAALAALSTFSREVVKDVEDVAGDRAEGLRTLPIVVGERRALVVAAVALAVAVAASPLPYVLGVFGLPYLVAVLPGDAVMLYAARRSFDAPGPAHRVLKYGMLLAAAAFLVGRAFAGPAA
jgi:geranylgeranylglycerol-phosphate geranylgeranyltransferase